MRRNEGELAKMRKAGKVVADRAMGLLSSLLSGAPRANPQPVVTQHPSPPLAQDFGAPQHGFPLDPGYPDPSDPPQGGAIGDGSVH